MNVDTPTTSAYRPDKACQWITFALAADKWCSKALLDKALPEALEPHP